MFVVRKLRGVRKEIGEYVRPFLKRVEKVTDVPHRVGVILVPGEVVAINDKCGFGCFIPTRLAGTNIIDNCDCTIFVATLFEQTDLTRYHTDCIQIVLETLCHEIAHYEQFRDRRKIQERGITVRSRNLLRLAESL